VASKTASKHQKNIFSAGLVSFRFVSVLTSLRQISAQKKSGSAQKRLVWRKYSDTDHWLVNKNNFFVNKKQFTVCI